MGFYGHIIKDPGQTQFYFDRKYSNLAELKRHETTDGIYAGRYVLVEYSEDFKFKGIALQDSNIIKEDDGSLYSKADGLLEGDFVSITIDKNTAVYKCISFTNKGIAVFDTTPAIQGEKINYYDFNYNVDRVYLQESFGRGYDSTVWQKVYFDDDTPVEKYVMIAELNSVTPTFKIITDAPTNETKSIEVRGDSTNLNYNIVMPAVWGFNLKSIDYNIDGFNKEKTKVKNSNNEFKISDVNDGKKYPIGQNDAVIKPNTKELIINLPSIGNTISDVWDVVYGKSEGDNPRPLYPVALDREKIGDPLKIYIDEDGKLYRALGETYIELPAEDNVGSLKALQLKMHKYLGTGEANADIYANETIPGTIHQVKNDFATLLGSEGDNKGFETIHGSLDSLEQYLGNENSSADFTTMHGAVKKLNETDNSINQEWITLLGENNSTDVSTIYGAINRTNEATNEAVNATINAKSATDSANAAASNASEATKNANTATERANTAATQTEEATTRANNLIGNETDTEMTTIYGAINRVNQVVANKFSANNVEETKEKVFISQAQKNSLFNGDDRLFYQKTETYNKNEVDTKIADLIGSAPETLNTLEELAAALGDNTDIIDALNGAIGTKQDKHVGEASRVLITNGNGDITTSKISNDELSYLSGVSSGIQEQFNNINSSINSISYAGSSEKGGAANSANKLNTNDGSKTQPVYFENGIPVATTYTLNASVPSGAKFTDTVYTHPTSSGNKHIPSGGSSGQILRWSADGTAVWGNDNNTTYSAATQSSAGLMSAKDKTKLDGLNFSSGPDLPLTLADGEIFFLIKSN